MAWRAPRRYGFAIKCTGCTVRDGAVVEVQAEALIDYDGKPPKGIIHWVSAAHAQPAEFRLFDVLFKSEDPMSFGDNWIEDVNPNSLVIKQVGMSAWPCAACLTQLCRRTCA